MNTADLERRIDALAARPIQLNIDELERRMEANAARADVQITTIAERLIKIDGRLERGIVVLTDEDTPLHVTDTAA